jgi:uncharacterized protein (DUF1778 family)
MLSGILIPGPLQVQLILGPGILACIDNVGTPMHIPSMPKRRSSSSENVESRSNAVAGLPLASTTKDSINLRMDARTRQLIDEAAAILGKTRTDFMVESARREATDVLLDQRLFLLEPERYDEFLRILDTPPAPGPKLRSLLHRVPAWKK